MRWKQIFIFSALITLFALALGVMYFWSEQVQKEVIEYDKKIASYQKDIQALQKEFYQPSQFIKSIEAIDQFAKEKEVNLFIKTAKLDEVVFSLNGELKAIMEVMFFCENSNNHTVVSSYYLKYSKDIKKSIAVVKLNLTKNLIKKEDHSLAFKSAIKKLANVFVKYDNEQNPRLYAIIGQYALINSKWLQKGDYFNDYKLVTLLENEVVLKRFDEKIILRLFDHE